MTQKHTEGPWAIETPCGFPYTGLYIVSHQANKNKEFHSFIAEVRQYREGGEAEANAALIAQAPTLLAERDRLREINQEHLAALKNLVDRNLIVCHVPALGANDHFEEVLDIIAKADTS